MGCPSKVCFAPGLKLEKTNVVSAKMVDQAAGGGEKYGHNSIVLRGKGGTATVGPDASWYMGLRAA